MGNAGDSNWAYWQELREQYVKNHPDKSEKIKKAILSGSVLTGMSKEDVQIAWPHKKPKINRSAGSWGLHEQWVYRYSSRKMFFLYFENGVMTSWSEQK